jgi:dCTP deaminase
MILSDIDIAKALKNGEITIKPFEKKRLQPASYDILLGNKFIVNDANVTHSVDPAKKKYAATREVVVGDGKEFILHPGVSVLGVSKDYLGSDMYLVQLGGKSSLARIGLLVHNTAGLINPGHYLNVTLELCNLNNVPIILRPGMEIAQVTFSMMSTQPKQNYREVGRYSEDNWNNHFSAKKTQKKTSKKK